MNSEGLKQAARNYLRALEDGSMNDCIEAKDKLAEIAILFAQGEAIEKVDPEFGDDNG